MLYSGAKTYSMDFKFPIESEEEVIEKYDKFFEEHKNVKIAVLGRQLVTLQVVYPFILVNP